MKYVHIAGTNGKGSVSEYISSILTAAGYRCGCYTSPHLISPTERMRIGGEYIEEAELCSLLDEVKERSLALNDTLFAAYTAAALLWFERRKVDFAVIETGIGGRLDPTNRIQPSAVVLTTIDYDHMDLLGDTLEKIAEEKCGIIKLGVPVFSAMQREEAVKVIAARCRQTGAPLRFVRPVEIISSTVEGQSFEYSGSEYSIKSIGLMQPRNAALAILAAEELGINDKAIKAGLSSTILECRVQFVPGDPDILIDGGHNVGAIDELMSTLDAHFSERNKVLLFACMKDKDHAAIIEKLKGIFSDAFVTKVDDTRGASPEVLCDKFSEFTECTEEKDPARAFEKAKRIADEQNAMLVVCGSFYLAGAVYNRIQKDLK
jgi:dihydrofolate synthase/folylpolyglutamate synthase